MLLYQTISNFCFLAYCGVYLKWFRCVQSGSGWHCGRPPRQRNHHICIDCISQHLLKCCSLPWRMLKKKSTSKQKPQVPTKGQRLCTCINHLLRKAAFVYLRNRVDKWNNTLQPHHMFIHWLVFALALQVKWFLFFLSFCSCFYFIYSQGNM